MADEQFIKKIEYSSNKFYNNALESIYIDDLSLAISMLEKSVAFNINNVQALNLLGLVYFEVGRVSDALEKWYISLKIKSEDNLAKDYISDFKSDAKNFEIYCDSIKMYNQAVRFMKQDNDDMAIIQLKKVIEKNPKFIDAMNLLSLAYMIRKEYSSSEEIIKKVLKIDINNSAATRYFKELYPQQSKADISPTQKVAVNKSNNTVPAIKVNKTINKGNSKIMEIITFIAGCICTIAVLFILVIPANVEKNKEQIETLEQNNTQLQQKYSQLQTQSSETIKSLQDENSQMKVQIDEYVKKVDIEAKENKIKEAQTLYKNGSFEEAADLISNIELGTGLSENVVQIYNDSKPQILKKAASTLYNKGKTLSKSNKNDEAKVLLNKAINYAQEDEETKYNCLYELGKISLNEDDNDNAKIYFTQVADSHPNSSMKNYAKNYLKGLE